MCVVHSVGEDVVPVNSVRGLLDVWLLWHTWLSGSLVHALLSLPCLLYRVYHTQVITFHLAIHFIQQPALAGLTGKHPLSPLISTVFVLRQALAMWPQELCNERK